jgi:hypothetical protein
MRKFILPVFLAFGVLRVGVSWADVGAPRPPDPKKSDEKPAPEMGEPGKGGRVTTPEEHEALHKKLAAESEANLKEIQKLMEKVQQNLSQKQTGDSTQNDQREVVKRLQELIDKVGKGCSSCSSSQESQSQSQGQESEKDKQAKKKQGGSEKERKENEKQLAKPDQKDQKNGGKRDPKDNGKVENDRKELGKLPPAKSATLAEKADILQRWGLLPKRVVEQMRNSNGKEYPAEYRQIISRYYEKLSQLYEESEAGGN